MGGAPLALLVHHLDLWHTNTRYTLFSVHSDKGDLQHQHKRVSTVAAERCLQVLPVPLVKSISKSVALVISHWSIINSKVAAG